MKSLGKELEKWLVNYKKNSVRQSSYLRYTVALKLFQRYDISKANLTDLTSWQVQDFINQLVEDGYSMETICKQYKLLKEFVDYALNEELMVKPVCSQVKLPNKSVVKKPKRDIITYGTTDQEALKRVLWTGESQAYYAVILMLETGMRAGEVLALYWSDINWRRRCVRISKTLVKGYDNNRMWYIQDSPKTDSSNRILPLSKAAIEALEQLRELNDPDNEKIFHSKTGGIITENYLKYWTMKACREAEVKYHGHHIFRHTFATNCYYKGCDVKLLSKFLGHANTSITYNTYIHLYGDALEDMRSIID